MILRHVTVDSADPYELAKFWSAVTGWPVSDEDAPGDSEVLVEAPSPVPGMLFIQVDGRGLERLPNPSHGHPAAPPNSVRKYRHREGFARHCWKRGSSLSNGAPS
ncbi:VOC family protein [Microtetraspora malaysiensis]|uniref:VOC family protein n=1 Tax=Microtetraspora malaysiensis TaxID=161358 RepID=UPI003D8E6D54